MFDRASPLFVRVLAAVAAAWSGAAGAADTVLVERGHWPVLIEPLFGRPGAAEVCSKLGPDDVSLTWNGEPLEVTALGTRPLPRTHALLIDASPSMLERLRTGTRFEEAKEAAVEYIDEVPEGDAILVASFNESLVLGVAQTRDKEAARRAVHQLHTGFYTALWDSLGYLVSYLDGLHGEKVIVLLSDGEDEGSYEWKSFEKVVERAAAARYLSIFPIGLGVSTAVNNLSRSHLGALAKRTGGEFFEISEGERLGQLFRRVHERLDRRLYVAYVPPLDGSTGKIRVRTRKGLPCKITSLGSSKWLEGGTIGDGVVRDALAPSESREAIHGRVDDLLVGGGPLFSRSAWENRGKLRVDLTSEPRAETREIVIFTPPLPDLRSRLTGPDDLLLYMLQEDLGTPSTTERPPFMVHGRTLLEMREAIGRAMFISREDYRSWAIRRVENEVEADLQSLLTAWGDERRPTEEELRRLRIAMIAQASDPSTGRPHLQLSRWLGDLQALETVNRLETLLINHLISGKDDCTAIESSWHKLGGWFPPAFDSRILAPLVPVYDSERDEMGFYRFVLPSPRAHGHQPMPLIAKPLALTAVRRVMEHPPAADLLSARFQASDVFYGDTGMRTTLRRECSSRSAMPRDSIRVEVSFSDTACDGEPAMRLVAYFPAFETKPGDPLCLWFAGGPDGLASRLNEIVSRSASRRRKS